MIPRKNTPNVSEDANDNPAALHHHAVAAQQLVKDTIEFIEGQGASWRSREAEMKKDAALAIYSAIENDVKHLSGFDVPLTYRARILQQVRAMQELVNL